MPLTQEQIDALPPPEELSRLFAEGESARKLFDEDGPPTLWSNHLSEVEHPPITQEMIDALGTPEELSRMFQSGRDALAFFQRHEREFTRCFPNEWVAVTESELVAHSPSFEDIDAELAARGVPRWAAFSWFLRDSESPLIL